MELPFLVLCVMRCVQVERAVVRGGWLRGHLAVRNDEDLGAVMRRRVFTKVQALSSPQEHDAF